MQDSTNFKNDKENGKSVKLERKHVKKPCNETTNSEGLLKQLATDFGKQVNLAKEEIEKDRAAALKLITDQINKLEGRMGDLEKANETHDEKLNKCEQEIKNLKKTLEILGIRRKKKTDIKTSSSFNKDLNTWKYHKKIDEDARLKALERIKDLERRRARIKERQAKAKKKHLENAERGAKKAAAKK